MGQSIRTQPSTGIQPAQAQTSQYGQLAGKASPYGVIPGTMATQGAGPAPTGVRPPGAPIPQMPVSGAPQGPMGAPAAGMPPSGIPQQGPTPQIGSPPVGARPFNPGAPGGMQPMTPPNRATIPPSARYGAALRGQTHV